MYTEYYNLKEQPFSLTSSPRFLYIGKNQKNALASLNYGVVESKGLILLTGEVGTGKTTLVQTLLRNFDNRVKYTYLSNPLLSTTDFFSYIASSVFQKRTNIESKAKFLMEFEEFLQQCLNENIVFLLIIDEAQALSFELLEEIRLLSNLESDNRKMINILLVGQPEINDKLNDPRCLSLLQRISIRYHISSFDIESTSDYINKHLQTAGANGKDNIFSNRAIKAIHYYSQGYPRMVNTLANNSLMMGYLKGKRRISVSMIRKSYVDLQLKGLILKNSFIHAKYKDKKQNNYLKWATLLLFISIIAILNIKWMGLNILTQASDFFKSQSVIDKNIKEKEGFRKKTCKRETEVGVEKPVSDESVELLEESTSVIKSQLKAYNKKFQPIKYTNLSSNTITVSAGDTISDLVSREYGWADDNLINLVLKKNYEITDNNFIKPGQKIIFPPLPKTVQIRNFTVHIANFKSADAIQGLFKDLVKKGYEVYIVPNYYTSEGIVSKITIGRFRSMAKAKRYAAKVLKSGVSDYAKAVPIEVQ